MSGYCKYCDSLVPKEEMSMLTHLSKHGDVWLKTVWVGCNDCAKGKLKNATVKKQVSVL